MLKLDVTADVAKATEHLSDLAQQHIPNAAAKALTRTAFDARDAVRDALPERFNLHRPWISRGIGVTPAKPRTLMAEVWSRDRFMALQETGGTKSGKLAIPVGPMAQTAQTRVIPKSQWPGPMLAKKNVFYRAGAVFERRDEKRILALYLLRKQQKVEPALLHKELAGRNSPDPRRSYAAATVSGVPSCVKRLSNATRTCSSAT